MLSLQQLAAATELQHVEVWRGQAKYPPSVTVGMAEDLLALEGMSETIAFRLAEQGIRTRDDLAECAVDELEDVKDLDPETAAKLIMEARAHWFAEEG